MEQIYIISGVHGCYKTLLALIEQFPNKQNSKIVFVGDLIDKGKNTHDVIEFVKWSRWKNHDNEEIFNVYGHTIFQEPLLNEYSCGIDLGCFYRNIKILPNPRLCALEFPSMKIYTQESLED